MGAQSSLGRRSGNRRGRAAPESADAVDMGAYGTAGRAGSGCDGGVERLSSRVRLVPGALIVPVLGTMLVCHSAGDSAANASSICGDAEGARGADGGKVCS